MGSDLIVYMSCSCMLGCSYSMYDAIFSMLPLASDMLDANSLPNLKDVSYTVGTGTIPLNVVQHENSNLIEVIKSIQHVLVSLSAVIKSVSRFPHVKLQDNLLFGELPDCNGGLISLSCEQLNYVNSSLSSSQVEENHAAHYMLKFVEEIDIQTYSTEELKVASCYVVACYVDACYVDEIEDATHYANGFKFNFWGASFTIKEDSVSIEIIANNINFRPPSKRKKIEYPTS